MKLFDSQTGQELLDLPGAGGNLVFSPDGKALAGLANNETGGPAVKVWDTQTGQQFLTFKAHSKAINDLVYSPDSKRLATHSRDGTVKVWDARTGKQILSVTVKTPPSGRGAVAFSPDGKRLAGSCLASTSYNVSAGGIGEIKVWDSETGQELMTLKGHTAMISDVAYSTDGKRLASVSGNITGRQSGETKIWDTETGQELLTLSGGSFQHRVAFGPDGNWLSSGAGGAVKIYDATPLPEQP